MNRAGIGTLLVCLCGVAACQDTTGTDTTPLTIQLTDAPGDVLEAVVTISQIYLQGDEADPADPADPGGRVNLLSQPVTTDLLTLVDDVATLVDMDVPSGTYPQLRFVIDGAYLRVEDADGGDLVYATPDYSEAPPEVDGTLMCPSCSQSGLKVTMPGGIVLDGTAQTLVVDFSVADSFGHEAGQSGKWVMHPSLKATPPQL
jgi:hypothetical protein